MGYIDTEKTGLSLANTIEEIKGNLWCSAPEKLNDPFDGIVYVKPESFDIEIDTTGDPVMKNLPNPYRIPNILHPFVACFSESWDSPPMWAHYSQFHGICLGYDFKKLSEYVQKQKVFVLAQLGVGYHATLGKVTYKEEFDISREDPFIKTDDWDYEDEWRIVVKGSPESVFDVIKKILDLKTEEDLQNHSLIKNYERIIDYKLKTYKKVCHGDLHTDNFFKDKKGIYLIDFGFTKELQAVIDHAFLECSIKFNHVPRYIDIKTLENLEMKLLDEETFSASYKFAAGRTDLTYYLDSIKRIRVNSNNLLLRNDKLEYFISLFIVSFKLIKYADLNQLYALHSAIILSEKIAREI